MTTISDQIAVTRDALSAVTDSPPGSRQRQTRIRTCLSLAHALHGERDGLVTYLDKGWVWLDLRAAQAGQPKYEAMHAKWDAALADYQTVSDLLREVLEVCCAPDTALAGSLPFVLRRLCSCGNTTGKIARKSLQDVVYCDRCGRYQYNAPRHETAAQEVA